MSRSGHLLIACPDQPGIVARVTGALFSCGANITESAQHSTDPTGGLFFMRVAFHMPALQIEALTTSLNELAAVWQMQVRLSWPDRPKRAAIFLSRESHCLLELLWQHQTGEIGAQIPIVISNHADHGETVRRMGYAFTHVPVSKDRKQDAEQQQLALLQDVDFIVLARYMQILSPYFIAAFGKPIINIHHSFLPAFVGARPYERAYERGVKIIGATAHYVTADLDAGPIIEQDIARVAHSNSVTDLKAIGRQIERSVLARAVRWHIEDRVIVHDNRTIVF
ncbi:MAG: formyltetrahydrofolate deformylase [Firmicutes bacterium]|nr:formyltetrahydrofolate deformylase [Bacillota bacterium]